jgi:hypothetical protein
VLPFEVLLFSMNLPSLSAITHFRSNIDLPPILSLYYDVQSVKGPNVRRSAKPKFSTNQNDISSNDFSLNDTSLNDTSEQVTDDELLENFTTGENIW